MTGLLRWETPVSDAGSLAMVALVDQNGLHITVQDQRDPSRRRYRFSFRDIVAYRNILEELRLGEHRNLQGHGWTFRGADSEWLRELRAREALLDVHAPGCQHYLVITEDDVIDVLSPHEPEIREVPPAALDEPSSGKSRTLHYHLDRPEVESLLEDVAERRESDV